MYKCLECQYLWNVNLCNLVNRNHLSPVLEFMRLKLTAVVQMLLIYVTVTKLGYKQDESVRSKYIAYKSEYKFV